MNAGVGFRLAQALGGKPEGRRAFLCKCPCPRHGRGWGDRHQSLRIRESADGAIDLTCLAGCAEDDVRRHVGRIAARHRITLPRRAS
jgi:hypothetical protein